MSNKVANTEKVNYYIDFHTKALNRAENLVKPYHEKRNKLEDLSNNEYTNMLVLEAEIRQLKEFIADLNYILEEPKEKLISFESNLHTFNDCEYGHNSSKFE